MTIAVRHPGCPRCGEGLVVRSAQSAEDCVDVWTSCTGCLRTGGEYETVWGISEDTARASILDFWSEHAEASA